MNEKILVYYTGGTIGMIEDSEGRLVPDLNFPANMRKALADERGLPDWEIRIRSPLLDSSNMTPEDWKEIAEYVRDNRSNFKAVVILHGTDTMAYTTSALSFILEGLDRPVVFTGSQVPLSFSDNDAKPNLVGTLRAVGTGRAPNNVCPFFGGRLLLGCRGVKVDAENVVAFDSPNYPPLATVTGDSVSWSDAPKWSAAPNADLTVQPIVPTQVGTLRLFPGISGEITTNFLQPPLQGAVLQAYGSGNGPTANTGFTRALKDATDPPRNVVIVACTQCLRGSANLRVYETGLDRYGATSGYDMTTEAALTKLSWLFSQSSDPGWVRKELEKNLRGELTPK
jgi:L-asparaginase